MSDKAATSGARYSVRCIHCQAVLKSPVPVPGGKSVKCPRCKKSFTTPGDEATKLQATTALEQPPATIDDDDEMAAALAKLQGDVALGATNSAPAPAPTPSTPAPKWTAGAMDDDDEMDAAIAKLQGDVALGAVKAPEPAPAPLAKSEPAIPDMEIPEVDDDLVVPDEEDEEEEPPRKKKRADDDEDEPRSKKKSKPDEEEDEDEDEPRSKKKSKRDEDVVEDFEMEVVDDDDDEPSAKTKRKRDDDDEEEDEEEPRSKKKRQRDDDDEEDEPRSTKKKGKKKAGSPLLLIGLIGGGVLALFICIGAGIAGVLLLGKATAPDIVGTWELRTIVVVKYEFRPDGTGKLDSFFVINFNYSQSGNELTITPTGVGGLGNVKINGRNNIRVRVTRTGDTMRWEDVEGIEPPVTLHKVR